MCVCNSAVAGRNSAAADASDADRTATLESTDATRAGMELADLDVRDAAVAVFAVGAPLAPARRLLPFEFGLDAQRFHLVHLADGFAQVLGELAAVVLVARVERDQHLAVDLLREADAVRVVWKRRRKG